MSDIASTDYITDRLDHTFGTYPTAFRSALEVMGNSPFAAEHSREVLRVPGGAEASYHDVLKELAYPSWREELGIIHIALHDAMATFSLRDCRVPTREEVLVGLFRGAIAEALNRINELLGKKEKKRRESRLFAVDLNVAGREGRTGGDIAFIFDVVMPGGERVFVPICLQAKRAAPDDGGTVDITRTNTKDKVDGDHQLKKLEEFEVAGCNCAYVFFNNDTRMVIDEPIVPILKTTSDIRAGVRAMSVDLASNSIDFPSYVLHVLSKRVKTVGSISGLQTIVATLAEGKVSHLVLISPDPGAWGQVMSFMKRQKGQYSEPRRYAAARKSVDFVRAFSEDNSYASQAEGSTYGHKRKI